MAEQKIANLSGTHFAHPNPTYISQIADASPSSVIDLYSDIRDPKAAKRFGAKSLEEFGYWAGRSCGITCIQMVIVTLIPETKVTTMELVNLGLKHKGYNVNTDTGWYHKALVEIASEFGLNAKIQKRLSTSQIATLVVDKSVIISSIYCHTKTNTDSHLILVYGCRINPQGKVEGFYYHDPNNLIRSGNSNFISREDFDRLTNYKGISIKAKVNKK